MWTETTGERSFTIREMRVGGGGGSKDEGRMEYRRQGIGGRREKEKERQRREVETGGRGSK